MRLFAGTPYDRPPHCKRCDRPETDCVCPPAPEPRTPPGKQSPRIGLEKRKGGRPVTVVRDLKDEGSHLPDLLTTLKSTCGAGGTLQDGFIEIQGDQRDRIVAKLQDLGYRPRRT